MHQAHAAGRASLDSIVCMGMRPSPSERAMHAASAYGRVCVAVPWMDGWMALAALAWASWFEGAKSIHELRHARYPLCPARGQ